MQEIKSKLSKKEGQNPTSFDLDNFLTFWTPPSFIVSLMLKMILQYILKDSLQKYPHFQNQENSSFKNSASAAWTILADPAALSYIKLTATLVILKSLTEIFHMESIKMLVTILFKKTSYWAKILIINNPNKEI